MIAAQTRAAYGMRDPKAKATILRLADDYDKLGDRALNRTNAEKKKSSVGGLGLRATCCDGRKLPADPVVGSEARFVPSFLWS
jgi:hypothetical protein